MKQEYNRAMEQVRLSPEGEARVLQALEEQVQAPRRKQRRGPLIAALAGAAALSGGVGQGRPTGCGGLCTGGLRRLPLLRLAVGTVVAISHPGAPSFLPYLMFRIDFGPFRR